MCMATLIPAGVEIPQEGLENGAVINDDGHGYAIASSRFGLQTFKSMKFEETLDHLISDRATHGPGSVVLFHSRFGTHGEMGPFNIHPFDVGQEGHTVMVHNGVLPTLYHPLIGDRRSDTRIFVDRVTPRFCDTTSGVPSLRGGKRLAGLIGSGNKLAFLSVKAGKPAVRLVNSQAGTHVDGVWYSNDGYRWGYTRQSRYSDWWGDHSYVQKVGSSLEEICPECEGTAISAALCIDCDYCLDCEEYLDTCMCWRMERGGFAEEDEQGSHVMKIEDSADEGWVKVDGVWRVAASMFGSNAERDTAEERAIATRWAEIEAAIKREQDARDQDKTKVKV